MRLQLLSAFCLLASCRLLLCLPRSRNPAAAAARSGECAGAPARRHAADAGVFADRGRAVLCRHGSMSGLLLWGVLATGLSARLRDRGGAAARRAFRGSLHAGLVLCAR